MGISLCGLVPIFHEARYELPDFIFFFPGDAGGIDGGDFIFRL
jgi:hypothetical protein